MAAWAVSRLERGGLVELSITAPGRGARLLRSEPPPPQPRPLPGRVIPCPEGSGAAPGGGSRTRAKRGCATAAGLRATAFSAQAGLPLRRGGNLEVRSRLEAPAPRFFVLAQSSAPPDCYPPLQAALAAHFWAAPDLPSLSSRCPQPIGVSPAQQGPPNPVPLGPRSRQVPGSPSCVSGTGRGGAG